MHSFFGLPVKHLDTYFWRPNWQEPDRLEFKKIHDQLCDQSEWIIEGISSKTAQYRFDKADMIIFLDVSRWTFLWRIAKRTIKNWGKEICAPGCKEKGPTMKFLSFVWNFNANRRGVFLDMIEKHRNKKIIKILSTQDDIENFCNNFLSKFK